MIIGNKIINTIFVLVAIIKKMIDKIFLFSFSFNKDKAKKVRGIRSSWPRTPIEKTITGFKIIPIIISFGLSLNILSNIYINNISKNKYAKVINDNPDKEPIKKKGKITKYIKLP